MSGIKYTPPLSLLIDNHGTRLGSFPEIDFTGTGVTATVSGRKVVVNVPGASGSATILNTAFVAKNGNDGTGTVGRLDLPFLTITAAEAAVISGQTIYVYAGVYSDSGLGKDGISYYFVDGASIVATNNIFVDTAGSISYSVSGNGSFTATSTAAGGNGCCLHLRNASTVVFVAKYLKGRNPFAGGAPISVGDADCVAYVTVFKSITNFSASSGRACVFVGDSTGLTSPNLYLNCPVIGDSTTGISVSCRTNGNCYVNSDVITGTVFYFGGNTRFYGDIVGTFGVSGIAQPFEGVGLLSVYGSITGNISISVLNGHSFVGDFYGKIFGVITLDDGGSSYNDTVTVNLYNDILATSLGDAVITTGLLGRVVVFGKVTNLDNSVISSCISVSNDFLLLRSGCVLVSFGSNSIVGTQTVTTYGLFQNLPAEVGITFLVGNVITDSNVV